MVTGVTMENASERASERDKGERVNGQRVSEYVLQSAYMHDIYLWRLQLNRKSPAQTRKTTTTFFFFDPTITSNYHSVVWSPMLARSFACCWTAISPLAFHLKLSKTHTASTFPSCSTVNENDDCRSHHITLSFCIFLIASHLCICARAKTDPSRVIFSCVCTNQQRSKGKKQQRSKSRSEKKKSVASHTHTY